MEKKYPEGHYMGMGIAIGMLLGVPMGLALGNIALGIGPGLAIGVAIGAGLEKKNSHLLRPLTQQEKKQRKYSMIAGIVLFVLGILVGLVAFMLSRG